MDELTKHVQKGYIKYAEEVNYRWITEEGKNTCEKCKSLNGKIFDKDNVPQRPHPNCRCRVEEISVVDDEVAKIYGFRDEKFNMEISAKEILGDLSVIRKKVYEELDNIQYSEIIEQKEKLLSNIDGLEMEVNRFIDRIPELNRHSDENLFWEKSMELIRFSSTRKDLYDKSEYLRLRALQIKFDEFVQNNNFWGPDAAALWKLSSSKFTDGLDYIEHNGYIINNISELYDHKLENIVHNKIKGQYGKNNSRGIVLNKNSSLATSVINSTTLDKFIRNNLSKILEQKRIDKLYIEFKLHEGTNNLLAFRKAEVLDIFLDDKNILHMKIFDTWDFNSNDPTVAIPRELQEAGFIENYYIILNISIPINKYLK